MFEAQSTPRVFYVPLGVDFPSAVIEGLSCRLASTEPAAWAKTHLIGNAQRMLSRFRDELESGPARLLPRLSLVTDLDALAAGRLGPGPSTVSTVRRQLDLANLVAQLIEANPSLAAPRARLDLARSLATLIDEMQSEGVPFSMLQSLDASQQSEHWQTALGFVRIASDFIAGDPKRGPEGARRERATDLIADWQANPPQHPIIAAGSTGSRGTTSLLLQAIATAPQGAVILPGFDPDMPADVWSALDSNPPDEGHPQYRFAAILRAMDLTPEDVRPWASLQALDPARNKVISLALRPAPVTDHWLRDGPMLGDLVRAMDRVTLIEARDQRAEANAIALRMRDAAENDQSVALITPDRTLSRRVAVALERWGLVADDSAGVPLNLTAPGRLLSQIARLGTSQCTADGLIALLKHPLVATGAEDRGPHLLFTRSLEMRLRRKGPPFPTGQTILDWAAEDETRGNWGAWLAPLISANSGTTLPDHIAWLIVTAEALAAGPNSEGSGALWEEAPGREALKEVTALRTEAQQHDILSPSDFAVLLGQVLAAGQARVLNAVHPKLMIWGTLEARVQNADLVILGGLNDGTWPEPASPDPWMNRAMRQTAGLLLPERQIGLSAHDFQQGIGGKAVWLTRSTKSDDAETVPSRWLNRITTLLGGLKDQGGEAALEQMRNRADVWLKDAARLDYAPRIGSAPRPAPIPPGAARPSKLSVTEIKTLIRDPYAIYAKRILRLRELDPLVQTPDARLRGTILHDVMEELMEQPLPHDQEAALELMAQTADHVLARQVPWPAARALWKARLMRAAPWFLRMEAQRGMGRHIAGLEREGAASIAGLAFTLVGKADRIDIDANGTARIYDYKTGKPPTEKEQQSFDKQLLLEAEMVARGDFKGVAPTTVTEAAFIGLGPSPSQVNAPLGDSDVWSEFTQLIARMFAEDYRFTARRALQKEADFSAYDHLSRFGEWATSDDPVEVRL